MMLKKIATALVVTGILASTSVWAESKAEQKKSIIENVFKPLCEVASVIDGEVAAAIFSGQSVAEVEKTRTKIINSFETESAQKFGDVGKAMAGLLRTQTVSAKDWYTFLKDKRKDKSVTAQSVKEMASEARKEICNEAVEKTLNNK